MISNALNVINVLKYPFPLVKRNRLFAPSVVGKRNSCLQGFYTLSPVVKVQLAQQAVAVSPVNHVGVVSNLLSLC